MQARCEAKRPAARRHAGRGPRDSPRRACDHAKMPLPYGYASTNAARADEMNCAANARHKD